jgi:2-polyprenyl-6-methoxyphenol hydroxylase-like FAD-dependent oxidoreductase
LDALDIGVIGCGSAGAAAALFLARAGHRVTVYERVADPRPVGAGITLQPTGQAVLARLGLLAPIVERGARLDRLRANRHGGKRLVELRYADVDPAMFGIGLHRGTLFQVLFDAVRVEPGVTLRLDAGCTSVSRTDGAGVTVHGCDGELGRHALVIAADGSVSELHATAGVPVRSSEYAWGALWFVGDDAQRTFDGELYQVVRGARRMYGILPTGRAPESDRPVVSLYWSQRLDDHPRFLADGLAAWKDEVRGFDPRVAPLLEQIRDPAQLVLTRYRSVRMARWHGDRVVFLGDAAHAMSPQLGQGCNLALWDAMVLADILGEARTLADGLAAYSRARARHLRHYQFMTRVLTPMFQSSSRVLGWLRDTFMPLAARLPPVERLMVRTMIGLERGIVRRPLGLVSGRHG